MDLPKEARKRWEEHTKVSSNAPFTAAPIMWVSTDMQPIILDDGTVALPDLTGNDNHLILSRET